MDRTDTALRPLVRRVAVILVLMSMTRYTPALEQVAKPADLPRIEHMLRDNSPHPRAYWDRRQGNILLLGTIETLGKDVPASQVRKFLVQRDIPRRIIDTGYDIRVVRDRQDDSGWRHLRLAQYYRDVVVWGMQLAVHISPQGELAGINGHFVPERAALDTRRLLDSATALQIAVRASDPGTARLPPFTAPRQVIYADEDSYRSAWMFVLPGTDAEGDPAEWRYFVDTVSGRILARHNRARTVAATGTGIDCDLDIRALEVFSDQDGFQLRDVSRNGARASEIHTRVDGGGFATDPDGTWEETETPVRDSQQPEVSIHYWLGRSYDLLKDLAGREGWDDNGLRIEAFAHFPKTNNASWLPESARLVFGESKGPRYRAFGCANDVIAHEFMHGVVEYTVQLDIGLEAGAMNESFADIFSLMVDTDDWLLGEGTSQSGMTPIRDIGNPASLGDPDHYSDINNSVHDSSNITSHAFFLAAAGLKHTTGSGYTCDVSLGRTAAFDHFYYVLDHFLTTDAKMAELAAAVSYTASSILAQGRSERADVFDEAFRRVGLGPAGNAFACAEPWTWMMF